MKGYSKTLVKISYDGEPKFYVNELKRTVTCKLSGNLNGPCEDEMWGDVDFPYKRISVAATARCHKDDEFDIERGKRIALSKAENELYSNASIEVSKFCEKLDFMRKVCDDFFIKSVRCQAHNIDYIDSLTMPEHPLYNKGILPRKRGTVVEHIK